MSMTIKRLTIENFRCFGAPVTIPFKPITMLFGKNSAGKSSVLKALLYFMDVLKSVGHSGTVDAHGGIISFGSFHDVVNEHNTSNKVKLCLEYQPDEPQKKRLSEISGGVDIFSCKVQLEVGVEDTDIQVWLNSELIVSQFDPKHGFFELTSGSKIVQEVLGRPKSNDKICDLTQKEFDDMCLMFSSDKESVDLMHPGVPYDFSLDEEVNSRIECFNDLRACFDPHSAYWLAVEPVRILLSELTENLRYIGPIRELPERNQRLSQVPKQNWYNGMAAWRELEEKLPTLSGMKKPYKTGSKQGGIAQQLTRLGLGYCPLLKGVGSFEIPVDIWQDTKLQIEFFKGEMATLPRGSMIKPRAQLTLFDEKTAVEVQPCDVGTGVSQVVPIVVGSYTDGCSLLSIEQPELHLHPRIQCDLGDIFIANMHRHKDRRFLIETHSEHLILRLLRRMRETASGKVEEGLELTPDDVAVLAVETGKNGTEIYEMEISEGGELLTPWPNGFFPERMNEILGG